MAITVTITKANTFDQFGRLLAVGTNYSLPDDLSRSLVQQLRATDTNGVMSYPYSSPFEFGGVYDTNGLLIGFKSANGIAALGSPAGLWANKPSLRSNERGSYSATDVGVNLNGVGGATVFNWTGTRWKLAGGNTILDAIDTPNTSIANTAEQQLNPNHILIPAGVLGINDRLRIRASFSKSNTAENATLRLRFGPLGTTADPIIATITTLAGASISEGVLEDFKIISLTTIQKLGNASTDQSYSGASAGAYPAAVAISDVNANGMYMTISSQVNVGAETVTVQDYSLELYPTDSA